MTIDIDQLRRLLNSTDMIDGIDLHANIKPIVRELLDRLEAAEKERDILSAELSKQQTLTVAAQHIAEVAQRRANQLQAKIEAMEKQEPVGWFARIDGDGPLMECKHADISRVPLYALPGATNPDCGEAGHDEGRCGNAQCLPGAKGE